MAMQRPERRRESERPQFVLHGAARQGCQRGTLSDSSATPRPNRRPWSPPVLSVVPRIRADRIGKPILIHRQGHAVAPARVEIRAGLIKTKPAARRALQSISIPARVLTRTDVNSLRLRRRRHHDFFPPPRRRRATRPPSATMSLCVEAGSGRVFDTPPHTCEMSWRLAYDLSHSSILHSGRATILSDSRFPSA
jgi:hypothetical protein